MMISATASEEMWIARNRRNRAGSVTHLNVGANRSGGAVPAAALRTIQTSVISDGTPASAALRPFTKRTVGITWSAMPKACRVCRACRAPHLFHTGHTGWSSVPAFWLRCGASAPASAARYLQCLFFVHLVTRGLCTLHRFRGMRGLRPRHDTTSGSG